MEEGSLRCDANVSVRLRGSREFGTKVEVKISTPSGFCKRLSSIEIERHIGVIESGGRISQETRLWNQTANRTDSMRSKRRRMTTAISRAGLAASARERGLARGNPTRSAGVPEAKQQRFVRDYGITAYDAEVLTGSQALADYFEAVAKAAARPERRQLDANGTLAPSK